MARELAPDKLRELKAQGVSDDAIAKDYRMSKKTVRKLREENGIPALIQRTPYTRKEAEERYERWYPVARQLRLSGKTYSQIEHVTGVKKTTLIEWMRESIFRVTPYDAQTMADITYEFIVYYKYHNHGNTPTTREIAKGIGCGSSSVLTYIRMLEQQKRITVNNDTTILRVGVLGDQWLPPSGVKIPARPRKKPREYNYRQEKRRRLARHGMLCDCGQEAKWVSFVRVGSAINEGGRLERLPLCDDCAEYEREIGGVVQPIDEVTQ